MGICGLGGLWRAILTNELESSAFSNERSHHEQSTLPSEVFNHQQPNFESTFSSKVSHHEQSSFSSELSHIEQRSFRTTISTEVNHHEQSTLFSELSHHQQSTLSSELNHHKQSTFPSEVFNCEQPKFGTLTQYDVFLNHRGPDLKKTFVSHLNKALHQVGRVPFLDGKALVKGQHALNSINKALNGVLVHVAIFSPRYAESKYCLNELCDMLATQKPMIPVFYNVKPENLRCIEVGPFAEAFRKHLKKKREQDVVRWKVALSQAAAITGYTLIDCDNDTVKLEEKIVVAVLDALRTPPPLASAYHPVGLNTPSMHIINKLHKMGHNVGIIGIYGMGGIGKTTLVREVYNCEQSNFNSRSFLKDVKEIKGSAVMDLQMKMMSDLLRMDAKKIPWNSALWFDMIRKEKILLVIDDINEKKQVDELIPDLTNLAPGSRVLITSRERDVLKNIMLDVPKLQSEMYLMPEMNLPDSIDLFCWCAFRKNNIEHVDPLFHGMVKKIVVACCGLPLALEVMGRFLADKKNLPGDEKYWRDATSALRRNGDIITKLQISYNGLVNDDDKRLFLDIACFMVGYSEKVAMEIWESSGDYGSASWSFRRLIEKCLVKVDDNGDLSMHDLMRDMGRNVVIQRASYKPEMQSHIWDPTIAAKILQKKHNLDEILALSMVSVNTGIACKAEPYARMKELRYLLLDGCWIEGDFSGWSEELRWLQWKYFPQQEFPWNLRLSNLVVLDLAYSKVLTHFWTGNFELEFPYGELRMLILNQCKNLKELPQCCYKRSKLKFVNLEGCCSLRSLPNSFGELRELEYLNISKCAYLTRLPESIMNLLKFKEIFLAGCSSLEKLPIYFGQLHDLMEVDFGFCIQLQNLCYNFGSLNSLRKLSLYYCESLIELPNSFSNLSNLEELVLAGCKLLQKLPPSICGLKKLRTLRMDGTALKELLEDFGQLQNLTKVDFRFCIELQYLCENFGSLGSLQELNLYNCLSLITLPDSFFELFNLEELVLVGCNLLQKFPPLHGLKKLKVLRMDGTLLKELPKDFGQLQCLAQVDSGFCIQLQYLCENFGSLETLQKLYLKGCESLIELPNSFSNLFNLEELDLAGCKLLQKLPPFVCGMKKLRILRMGGTVLKELPKDFGRLQSLTEAEFGFCIQLQNLCVNIGWLGNLQKLYLQGCKSLTALPDSFSNLCNLEALILTGCKLLRKLPPIHGLKKLTILRIDRRAWKELPEDFIKLLEDSKELNTPKELAMDRRALVSEDSKELSARALSIMDRTQRARWHELPGIQETPLSFKKTSEKLNELDQN